jgi:hypothetical protein
MMMQKVLNVTAIRQAAPNSCWAACVQMVLRHDDPNGKARHLMTQNSLAKSVNLPLDLCADVAAVMKHFNIWGGTDDTAQVPTFDEIKEEIDQGRPIIECVSEKAVRKGADVIAGHYVLIVGYNSSAGGEGQIVIIDPAEGLQRTVDYNKKMVFLPSYGKPLFWGMPFYTEKGSP